MIKFELDGERKEILRTSKNHSITKEDFIKKFGENFEYEILINHKNTTQLWEKRFNDLFGKHN